MGKSKSHEKKHKKEKKRRKYSSSSSEESEEEIWVEVDQQRTLRDSGKQKEDSAVASQHRDEWMSSPAIFPTYSREVKKEKANHDKHMLDKPGQSSRELNPYWKDGGTGLPEEKKSPPLALSIPKNTVGDQGSAWLKKALQRAKEQALEERRSLEDVVTERWGSLEKLESMLAEAEQRENKYNKRVSDIDRDLSTDNWKSKEWKNKEWKSKEKKIKTSYSDEGRDNKSTYTKSVYSKNKSSKDNNETDFKNLYSDRKESTKKIFLKPKDEISNYSTETYISSHYSHVSSASSKGWKKKEFQKETDKCSNENKNNQVNKSKISEGKEASEKEVNEQEKPLSDKEMNELGAKITKAEIIGNTELAEKLKARLQYARESKQNPVVNFSEDQNDLSETVILMKTDAKGFVRPLKCKDSLEPSGSGRKREKVETHSGGQRVRYFADDDKYSLQELFEKEKFSTVEDQNMAFGKIISKIRSDDMDDAFEDSARIKVSAGKVQARERSEAIKEHLWKEKVFDSCQWCFESRRMLKHLIIAIGVKCYLCVPPYRSLTEGHCLIVPMSHITCATQVDEDVWEEVQTFRKSVTSMFKSQDEDVIFFESAMNLKKMPHMVLHCVPLPKESGDVAPVYFKKAILECETEWSTNKKLIDLSGKDVRKAVPKGLPYFFVDFGLQSGYAHVIEDEKIFPRNFAQEIIGGMLDVDHGIWRKEHKENFEKQREKVLKLAKLWEPFNCTKK